jgi:hypothetical protein
MNNYLFVAYYTPSPIYEEAAKKLEASLIALKLRYKISCYPSRGSWLLNTGFKPEFIYEMMCKNPDYDIVYVDADAIVRKHPVYFDTFDGDIGVHYKNGEELLSGTIYLKNCEKVRTLITYWMSSQQHYATTWDQKVLNRVLGKFSRGLDIKVVDLPPTYTQIFDTMRKVGDPVIEHFQASRQQRKVEYNERLYPMDFNGARIRVMPDGTFTIPRKNKSAEDELDKVYLRIPGSLRWYPRDGSKASVRQLKPLFSCNYCYIVGKGPSLDLLNKECFPNTLAPIIGINEAIHQVEKLDLPNPTIMMQQDIWLKESCRPKRAQVVISQRIRDFYSDIEDRIIFYGPEIGAPIACLTASYAICMAKFLGCHNFGMVCFDSCVNRSTSYAKCVGYEPTTAGKPERFLKHRSAFEHYLGKDKVEWILPSDGRGAAIDR